MHVLFEQVSCFLMLVQAYAGPWAQIYLPVQVYSTDIHIAISSCRHIADGFRQLLTETSPTHIRSRSNGNYHKLSTCVQGHWHALGSEDALKLLIQKIESHSSLARS